MIQTSAALSHLIQLLHQAPWVAIDTEADSLHAYPEKLCLVQICFPGFEDLVDPLVPGLPVEELLTACQSKPMILHGADYDLRLLHRRYGFVPSQLFDTMWAARLCGMTMFGLADLARQLIGVELPKGGQKANWSIRPISPALMEYALNDTRHLNALAEKLRERLNALGRLEWVEECCAKLVRDAIQPVPDDPENDWRLKGSDRLSNRALAVVRELYYWRDAEATRRNKPPFFILTPDRITGIAVEAASSGVGTVRFDRVHERIREAVRAAVGRAMALPDAECPRPRTHVRIRMTSAQTDMYSKLEEQRNREASRLELDPSLIASRATLVQLSVKPAEARARLMRWQERLLFPV